MRIKVRNRDAPVSRVLDKGTPTLEQVGVFASEKIGATRSMTPQGYMLCQNVPIARTGVMYYMPEDLDGKIPAGPEGHIKASRDDDELFRPETLASFVAMPVTDEHPESGDVGPTTWNDHARGFVLNARQGEGEFEDCIVCDLMITSADAINEIKSGKREVSAGYDCGYLIIEPGRVAQVNIMGNHVALVDRGRCGARCAIGDSATVLDEKGKVMPQVKKVPPARVPLSAAMRERLLDAAEEAFNSTLEEEKPHVPPVVKEPLADDGSGTHTHIHIHGMGGEPVVAAIAGGNPPVPAAASDGSAPPVVGTPPDAADPGGAATPEDRLTALETGMQQILVAIKGLVGAGGEQPPPGAPTPPNAPTTDGLDDDEDMPENVSTTDSASLADLHASSKASAEILFPGFVFPDFDPKVPSAKTRDSICAARRRCLDMAYSTAQGRKVVDTLRGTTKTLDVASMTCVKANLMFKAAAGVLKATKTQDAIGNVALNTDNSGKPPVPRVGSRDHYEQMNAEAKAMWAQRAKPVLK